MEPDTLLLAFAPLLPVDTQWLWLMVMFVLANIGSEWSRGILQRITTAHIGADDEMDRILISHLPMVISEVDITNCSYRHGIATDRLNGRPVCNGLYQQLGGMDLLC